MATNGKINGNKMLLFTEVVPGTAVAIACTTEASLSANAEQIDATCKDNDGAPDSKSGTINWEVSTSGLVVFNDDGGTAVANGVTTIRNLFLQKTRVLIRFGTAETGDEYLTGTGLITSYEENGPLNSIGTWSVTITGVSNLLTATN